MAKHYAADDLLEQGVMAELDGKSDPAKFRQALKLFEETLAEMDNLDRGLVTAIEIHKKGTEDPAFATSVTRIMGELRDFRRISLRGSRFSNVSASTPVVAPKRPTNLLEIMEAQREDLGLLRKQLVETIESFRAVIPLAEKKQFVPMMLSGRAGFSSKVQQSVDLLGEYSRSYSKGCMTTIEATMQVYPKGFDWLPKVPDDLAPAPTPTEPPVEPPAQDGSSVQPPPPSSTPPPAESKKKGSCQVGGDPDSLTALLLLLALVSRRGRRHRARPTR
jgi:MYXO-CTERM domain-containing protein